MNAAGRIVDPLVFPWYKLAFQHINACCRSARPRRVTIVTGASFIQSSSSTRPFAASTQPYRSEPYSRDRRLLADPLQMDEQGLGVRYTGVDRRHEDRRTCERGSRDRRRRERRRNRFRSLLFSALAIVAPPQLKSAPARSSSRPSSPRPAPASRRRLTASRRSRRDARTTISSTKPRNCIASARR